MVSTECESCWYYDYDEEFEEYYCMMDLDEDEVYRIMTSRSQHCPYYRQGDDYTLARRPHLSIRLRWQQGQNQKA